MNQSDISSTHFTSSIRRIFSARELGSLYGKDVFRLFTEKED
jgi:hypothetical protein